MIYLFPNLEALRIALTSGQIPPEVSREPVEAAFQADGSVTVKPHAIPPRAMQNALKRLGIKSVTAHVGEPAAIDSWPQILPLVRLAEMPDFAPTTPVLFEMPVERFHSFATEMLRLGNDRQSFRTIGGKTEADQRVLLRVVGPPYYTLLRALDRLNPDVTAYLEQAPGLWIEIGFAHPLAAQIKAPDAHSLLLRFPREWKLIAEEPFQDIYEVLDFQLPTVPTAFTEGKLKGKLIVPLRLAAGNAAEVPEMWVLQTRSVATFDAFVRDADERLMNRLMFAVAANGENEPIIVLRTRTSRLAPPAIELDGATGYVPFRRLNNLYLPVGTRLQPTLRRDAIRRMLAADDAQVVWLSSLGDGRFIPESLPETAFRPLADWVDYVIDQERKPLQDWIQATRFDFDDFVCKDEKPIDPPRPPGSRPKTRRPGERPEKPDGRSGADATQTRDRHKTQSSDADAYAAPKPPPKPDELKIRRGELEKAFLAVDGPLDAPERLALWPQLAEVNAALGDQSEAAICWLNGFWEMDEVPAEAARAWLRAEEGAVRNISASSELDRLLSEPSPLKADLRRFAAILLFSAADGAKSAMLKKRAPEMRAFLERFDRGIPIRAAWLAWKCFAHLSGDVLVLARVRDRILDRLMEKGGLDLGLDAPSFIDLTDTRDGDRIRQLRDRVVRLHRAAQQWHDRSVKSAKDASESPAVNKPFVDLAFAFGMAVLGQESAARDLIHSAGRELLARPHPNDTTKPDDVGAFLLKAFSFRIERALKRETHGVPLPAELVKRIEEIDLAHRKSVTPSTERYVIDRFREHSWILDPNERFDPYAKWKSTLDWQIELSMLSEECDPARLEERIRRLLRLHSGRSRQDAENRVVVLSEALACAWRVGREFSIELTGLIPTALAAHNGIPVSETIETDKASRDRPFQLLERGIYLAGHYGERDVVQSLFQRFLQIMRAQRGTALYDAVNLVARESLRNLRKLGLQNDVDAFLHQVSALVIQGKGLPELKSTSGKHWPEVLRTLVHLAEGWLVNRNTEAALPFLDEARDTLFSKGRNRLSPQPLAHLARAYVCAVAQFPVAEALKRLEEMFENIADLPNSFTSRSWYSRLHTVVVEEVVCAVVNDHFVRSEAARGYLEDDEYLVRRRIHNDMRKLLAQTGL